MSTPQNDTLVIRGDFSARLERDYNGWEVVLGRRGVGKVNDNSLIFLDKFEEHDFCIAKTLFGMDDHLDAPEVKTLSHNRFQHCLTTGY